MSNHNLLLNYLYNHQFIDAHAYDALVHTGDVQQVRDSLLQSGVIQHNELVKLESLLSSIPLYHKALPSVSTEALSLVPYEVVHKYRIICVDHTHAGLVLFTDQMYLNEELFVALPEQVAGVYRITTPQFDTLLENYRVNCEELMRARIESVARRVRTIESYGSRSMAMFFPDDHKREIAEDISSKRLLEHLVALADVKLASRITLRLEGNRLRIYGTICEEEHPLVDLPRAVAYAVYLKLRYLADAPLDEVQEMQEVIISNLDADDRERTFRVGFVPHTQGTTCIIEDTQANQATLSLSQAGLGDDDVRMLNRAFHLGRGMLLVSGIAKSGTSFVLYRLAEALGVIKRTTMFETSSEYTLSNVDQQHFSKRKDKDLQLGDAWYDALILNPLDISLVVPVYNIACRKFVVAYSVQGVAEVVRVLLAQGVRAEAIARTLKYNLITHPFSALTPHQQVNTRALSEDEVEHIEQHLSFVYFKDILTREGENQLPDSWQSIRWKTQQNTTKKSWFNWRSVYHTLDLGTNKQVYARSVVPVGELIASSQAQGESFVQFAQTLKRAQKEHILPRALMLAYRGETTIDEVLTFLRN